MKRFIHRPLRTSVSAILTGIVVSTLVVCFMVMPQFAATLSTFTVNSTVDAPDITPGDGICDDGLGNCTLRAAIMESNFVGGSNVITVPAGTYTLTGPADDEFNAAGATMESGDLDIVDLSAFALPQLTAVTINGAGAGVTIIDAGGVDRVLDINNFAAFGHSVDVTLSGLTIRNGNAPSPDGFNESGGGIQFDGFDNQTFLPTGTLTIDNCVITSNTAAGQGGGVLAIFGSLLMSGTQVSGNTATAGAGGGISYDGSAGAGLRTLQITTSSISGNHANNGIFGRGGGIWEGGNANKSITHSSITTNTAGVQGGGVFNGSGSLTLNFNVIVGNTASGDPASTGLRNNTGAISADNNWWGCNQGPAVSPCDRVSGPLGAGIAAWLLLNHSAAPNSIEVNQAATLQADFFTNSLNTGIAASDLVALNGRPVTFNNAVLGTISGADPTINAGKANATFTAGNTGGNGSADATVDHATVTAGIFIGEAAGITCPSNIVESTAPGQCSKSVAFSASATGLPAPTVTYKIGATTITSPHTFSSGTTTVTATASNGVDDDATCTFTVTVNDDEAPSISCPANITTTSDPGSCGAVVTYTAPTGTDNCPGATTTQTAGLPSGSPFPVGTTTNTFKVTDAVGHETSCSFTVTVTDNEDPVVTVPANITVSTDPGQCNALVTFSATAADNCPTGLNVVSAPASGSAFPKGTTTVTTTATDASGNTDVETFTVTVNDEESPSITCPANITTNVDSGSCGAVVTYAAPVGTDNCPGATTMQTTGLASGATYPVGTTTNTFKVTDASGHETTCSFTVTVVDNVAPSISCPANISTNVDPGTCGAVVNYTPPVGTDNCPGATTMQTAGLPSGSTFPIGTTTNTFTVTDASGQQASCSFTVTVTDNEAPTITLNGQTPVLWPPNHDYHTINITDLVTSASDTCDAGVDINDVVIASVSSDEEEDGPADGSTLNDIVIAANCKSVQLRAERQANGNGRVYTITFKVTDASNNSTTVTAQVIVPNTSQNSGAVLGPGPGYTVTSGCP